MSRKYVYDYLVVGAGVYGATVARELTDAGFKVLVIDKREHVAGNAYTDEVHGIMVHRYGPHIFHTSDDDVWRYVQRFAEFNRFTNAPLANYRGEMYNLPFNMNTFRQMWGVEKPEQALEIIERQRAFPNPKNLEQKAISMVGSDVYEKLVQGYTEKQWGRPCRELPPEIITRLPVRFTYDNDYFGDKHQGIPVYGYTAMVERMLDGVDAHVGIDFFENHRLLRELCKHIVFTGPIDAYYGWQAGKLEYRTVRFADKSLSQPNYQGNAVVNYTSKDVEWTRIIEHKWFTFGKDTRGNEIPNTIITYEYSKEYEDGDEPFYPVNDRKNNELYARYKAFAERENVRENKVVFGGRLGEYRYYNMDQAIAAALEMSRKLIAAGV